MMFLHVTKATYLDNYRLQLIFNNEAQGIVDLEPELHGEIFEPLQDLTLFKQFTVTSRTVEWPNGADFAPEFLYQQADLTVQPNPNNPILVPQME